MVGSCAGVGWVRRWVSEHVAAAWRSGFLSSRFCVTGLAFSVHLRVYIARFVRLSFCGSCAEARVFGLDGACHVGALVDPLLIVSWFLLSCLVYFDAP